MKIIDFIDRPVGELLSDNLFKDWPVERTVENDLDERIIHYVFIHNGLELRCDKNDVINVIFIYSKKYSGFNDKLIEISFEMNRDQVLSYFGNPTKSGEKINDSVLGEYGAWDRFDTKNHSIHIEYNIDSNTINKITIMTAASRPS